jgi:hypothetical protein
MQLAIGKNFRLRYQSGNENNPGNPVGAVWLTILGDGAVQIEQRALGGKIQRSFAGTTTRDVIERVLGHLREGGFPDVPKHRIPMGATLRTLTVESGGETAQTLPTSWSAVDAMPGYREAYQLLDSITTLASGGALEMIPSPTPDVAAPATIA